MNNQRLDESGQAGGAGIVEQIESQVQGGGWTRPRQPAPRMTVRADIPGGDEVAIRRLSGPRDALSVRRLHFVTELENAELLRR